MDVLRCSFCNKRENDVAKLIAGPSVFICDECIAVCNDIIAADVNAAAKAGKENPANIVQAVPIVGLSVPCSLCRMPTDVAEGLMIPNRGILCVGCVVEIEAAVAERGEGDSR